MSEINVAEIEKKAQQAMSEDVIEYDDLDKDPKDDDPKDDPKDKFNIDEALDSFSMVSLDGKISKEDAEEKASERGWREDGEDKFGHKISAIEFLERAPLFHKMDLLRGDLKKQQKQIDDLASNSKKIVEKSIADKKKMVEDFKAEKDALLSTELLDADDIKKLKVIDKQIEENQVEDVVQDTSAMDEFNEAKDNFKSNNDWYDKNRAMTLLADSVGQDYAKSYYDKHGELPDPTELFKHVMGEVENDFPDLDKPKKQTRVASQRNRSVTKIRDNKKSLSDLPGDQQAIAREVIESVPGMTEESYLKTYEAN